MQDDEASKLPKEGSNHIDHQSGQFRANISETITNPYPNGPGKDPGSEVVTPAKGDNKVPQPEKVDREPQE